MPNFKTLSRLGACENGATAIIFALMLIPIIVCIGTAVDYTRLSNEKAAMQEYLDAAILAGTVQKDIEPKERIQVAEKYFYAALPDDMKDYATALKVDLTPDENGLRGELVLDMPTSIMNVVGKNDMNTVLVSQSNAAPRNRQLDMVFCIDASGSMQDEIDGVTNAAYNLEAKINEQLEADDKAPFDAMRVRVIFFRDFGADFGPIDTASPPPSQADPKKNADDAMLIPPMNRSGANFYALPQQSGAFKNFLDAENANGGDDEPEAGFVCLNEALESNWAQVGDILATTKKAAKITEVTHLIAMWGDANARPIVDPRARMPRAQPNSYADLEAKWNDKARINQKNKLLVFFGDLDRACATREENPEAYETPDVVVATGPESTLSDETGSVPDRNCPTGGEARWRESIGTWGLGKNVFNYSMNAATYSLANQLADAVSKQPLSPRLTK